MKRSSFKPCDGGGTISGPRAVNKLDFRVNVDNRNLQLRSKARCVSLTPDEQAQLFRPMWASVPKAVLLELMSNELAAKMVAWRSEVV